MFPVCCSISIKLKKMYVLKRVIGSRKYLESRPIDDENILKISRDLTVTAVEKLLTMTSVPGP